MRRHRPTALALAAALALLGFGPNVAPASVRWGDIYKSTIAFQWIDITGLASGDYLIKIVVDPPWETGGRFLESNESNNRGWAKIRLTRTTVTVLSKSARP